MATGKSPRQRTRAAQDTQELVDSLWATVQTTDTEREGLLKTFVGAQLPNLPPPPLLPGHTGNPFPPEN